MVSVKTTYVKHLPILQPAVVQSLGCVQLFVTPWTADKLGTCVLHCLLEFAQIHVHWAGDVAI